MWHMNDLEFFSVTSTFLRYMSRFSILSRARARLLSNRSAPAYFAHCSTVLLAVCRIEQPLVAGELWHLRNKLLNSLAIICVFHATMDGEWVARCTHNHFSRSQAPSAVEQFSHFGIFEVISFAKHANGRERARARVRIQLFHLNCFIAKSECARTSLAIWYAKINADVSHRQQKAHQQQTAFRRRFVDNAESKTCARRRIRFWVRREFKVQFRRTYFRCSSQHESRAAASGGGVATCLVFIDTSLNEAENSQGKSLKLIILTENKLLTLSLVLRSPNADCTSSFNELVPSALAMCSHLHIRVRLGCVCVWIWYSRVRFAFHVKTEDDSDAMNIEQCKTAATV